MANTNWKVSSSRKFIFINSPPGCRNRAGFGVSSSLRMMSSYQNLTSSVENGSPVDHLMPSRRVTVSTLASADSS